MLLWLFQKTSRECFFLHEPLKHARYWTGGQLHLGIRGISTSSYASAGTADIRIVSNGGRITPYNMYWHIGGHNDGTGKINISFWKTITYNVYTNIYSNNLVSNSKNGYNGPHGVICSDTKTYPGKTVYLQRYRNPKTGSGVTSPSSNGEFYINPHYTGIYLENTTILGNIYIASKKHLGVSKSWITTVNELPEDEKTKKDFYIYTQIQDEVDEYGNMETYHFDIKYY